jgi:hypothetical protein
MTRDEIGVTIGYLQADLDSIKRRLDQCHADRDVVNTKLEMLRSGMLKLDEPKREPQFSLMEAVRLCRSAYIEGDAFVRGLELHGYKIVEK